MNVKVVPTEALHAITKEHRLLRGDAADGEDAPLEACIRGFEEYFQDRFGCLIQLPVADDVPRQLYHDSGMCDLTGQCWRKDCSNHRSASSLTAEGGEVATMAGEAIADVAELAGRLAAVGVFGQQLTFMSCTSSALAEDITVPATGRCE